MIPLESSSVHVWHTAFDCHSRESHVFQRWLSVGEKARADKLKRPYRQRFILTRGLLRKLLSRYNGQPPEKIHFSYTPSGKPLLLGSSFGKAIEFNVSHSNNRVAFAFTVGTPIGIDLEFKSARKYIDQIAYRFFSKKDYEQLQTLTGNEKLNAFFKAWVANEASVKAWGHSLKTHPFSQYTRSSDKEPVALHSEKYPCSLFDLAFHPDFAAALAIKGDKKTIIIKKYD
jgi:4'-phosphopantetheinyl transferase